MANRDEVALDRLLSLTEKIAGGSEEEVNSLLKMTGGRNTPPKIAALAETFGLMNVQVASREWRLELLVEELLSANLEMLELLGVTIAKRDSDTGEHNYRVTIYAVRLAEAVGVAASEIRTLIKGAFLHDIGKIGTPDHILLKPGRLTESEFDIMRQHVRHGVDIVDKSTWLRDAADVVHYHHEKFNGTGYPRALAGNDIPLTARIFAIVDVFDALTSQRPYKKPMGIETSLEIIRESSGSHFDPALVDVFCPLATQLHGELSNRDEAAIAAVMRELVGTYF